MTVFFKLLNFEDKADALKSAVADRGAIRYEVDHSEFRRIPGSPFAYWLTDRLRSRYTELRPFESSGRSAKQGLATTDDFRFLRVWWEVDSTRLKKDGWAQFARSGGAARYYGDSPLVINWFDNGVELKSLISQRYGNAGKRIYNEGSYFAAGFCWPLRGSRLSVKAVGPDSVFGIASKMAFVSAAERHAYLALLNSTAFDALLKVQAGSSAGVQYESGLLARVPVPELSDAVQALLEKHTQKLWTLTRALDSRHETSHAFLQPALLQVKAKDGEDGWQALVDSVNQEIQSSENEIDRATFDAYGLDTADREALADAPQQARDIDAEVKFESQADLDDELPADEGTTDSTGCELLSWCIGVAFGRFDWRLATGERDAPPEPKPFDPLPAKSPGMLPDGADAFHAYAGVLVDDPGHPHDLVRLAEEVLIRVDARLPGDLRRWLQKDFFPFHLQRFSKSRRKAPIYWPLATASGNYTLWLYYPSLSSQTLYTAINDFLDGPNGKLTQVAGDVAALRSKGAARTRDEENRFERMESLELELIELRDQLLKIAPTYIPNHDDGVQITGAPLWRLFRHKPWQKILKDTWAKLEKGDYDWAHLAMNYWPDRVREKCKTDKSLSIAHGLEDLYVAPEAKPKKARSGKGATKGSEIEW